MSRKDFIVIAHILKRNRCDPNVVFDFASYLAGTSPRFSKARFLAEAFDNKDYGKVISKLGENNG